MGQKTNPIGIRLKINRFWDSIWYSEKEYANNLIEDIKIRRYIEKRIFRNKIYNRVEISDIKIKRFVSSIDIYIYSSRPGIIIGKRGADIDELKKELKKITNTPININVNEIKKVDLDAKVLSQMVGRMIEGRRHYKKSIKHAIARSINAGALGVKMMVSGRLGGSDMSRTETFKEGSIPLQTFDSLISYCQFSAHTTYGIIGITVWVYVGQKSKKNFGIEKIGNLITS
jgi:small subunit ribosomal protein S3